MSQQTLSSVRGPDLSFVLGRRRNTFRKLPYYFPGGSLSATERETVCPWGLRYPVTESELSDSKPQKPHHSVLALVAEAIRRRQWQPTPVLLPGKSHGRRSLVGCSPWGCEESDSTERLHFHFSLSCIEEGNGNPLQSSCLKNPRDGGAWWAAVYGATESETTEAT